MSNIIKMTAEHQALLKLAATGMYLSNGATDERLRRVDSVYGAYRCAFVRVLKELFPEDVYIRLVQAEFEYNDKICEQVRDYIFRRYNILVILL